MSIQPKLPSVNEIDNHHICRYDSPVILGRMKNPWSVWKQDTMGTWNFKTPNHPITANPTAKIYTFSVGWFTCQATRRCSMLFWFRNVERQYTVESWILKIIPLTVLCLAVTEYRIYKLTSRGILFSSIPHWSYIPTVPHIGTIGPAPHWSCDAIFQCIRTLRPTAPMFHRWYDLLVRKPNGATDAHVMHLSYWQDQWAV